MVFIYLECVSGFHYHRLPKGGFWVISEQMAEAMVNKALNNKDNKDNRCACQFILLFFGDVKIEKVSIECESESEADD